MTNKEIEIQKALGTYLSVKWEERNKLQMKADKLYTEGGKLKIEGDKLHTEGDKLQAEGDELYTEGDKLQAEGDKLYIDAVMKVYGSKAIINWADGSVKINEQKRN